MRIPSQPPVFEMPVMAKTSLMFLNFGQELQDPPQTIDIEDIVNITSVLSTF